MSIGNISSAALKAATVVAACAIVGACSGTGGGLFGSNQPTRDPSTIAPAKVASNTLSNSSIPVLVNDQPITKYDIDQRQKLMRIGGAKGGRSAAVEELIDETLQNLEAQRRGVRVPDSRVDGAYGSIAKNLKLSTSQLGQALRKEGINPDSLKRRLRTQMAWQQLVQQRTRAESRVSTSEVNQALQKQASTESLTLTEYFLQQIIFVVPRGSANSRYTQRRSEANAFRQRYQGCNSALEQAQSLQGVVVKDLGRRSSAELGGSQGEELQKTPVGKTISPNRIPEGIELIGICSKREVQSAAAARAQIENKFAIQQAEGLGKDYLKELRDRAIIEYR